MGTLAVIVEHNVDLAKVFELVSVVLACVAAVISGVRASIPPNVPPVIGWLAIAFLGVGLLVLI